MTHHAVQLLFVGEFIGISIQIHTFMHIKSMQKLMHTHMPRNPKLKQ